MIRALTDGCSRRGNEDRFGYASGAAWVLDGATDVSGTSLKERTTAWWLVEAYQAELQNQNSLGWPDDARELMRRLACGAKGRLEAQFGTASAPISAIFGQASTALSLVRRVQDGWSVVCLADCPVLYRHPVTGRVEAISDPGFAPFDRRALEALHAAREREPGAGLDRLVELIRPLIEANRASMNMDGGYAIGAIQPPPDQLLAERRLPEGVEAFAILSDGFSRWYDLFKLGTPDQLFSRMEEGAMQELLAEIRQAEDDDPDGRRFPRFKKHDDATCLYFEAADL